MARRGMAACGLGEVIAAPTRKTLQLSVRVPKSQQEFWEAEGGGFLSAPRPGSALGKNSGERMGRHDALGGGPGRRSPRLARFHRRNGEAERKGGRHRGKTSHRYTAKSHERRT